VRYLIVLPDRCIAAVLRVRKNVLCVLLPTWGDRDRYGRIVAICRVSGEDLGAILVREGFAWAFTRFSVDCVDQQEEARTANRGHPLKLLGSAIADQEPVNFKVSRAL
jgi:hypothetical protein